MAEGQIGKVGTLDRAARIVLAIVLLGFALFCPFAKALGPIVVWSSGIVGAVFLLTAVLGRCPIYRVLGTHT